MTLIEGPVLPLVALAWPLMLGAFVALRPVRAHALRVLPVAPLPALWLALSGSAGETLVPGLLLGTALDAEPAGMLLFGMAAAIWTAAGIYAQSYMKGARRPAVFAGFWCLTLAGNLGVFLAADVVTFYAAFAAVSLAAYILVVEDGTPAALRAGRVYLGLAVIGEACLLLGLMIGAAAADGIAIAAVRAALGSAPLGPVGVALLVAGLGIKAGLVPLHVWLPLAHPAAPTPASAVLSGAIVKAGLIGLLVLVPEGAAGGALLALGFAGAFGAALYGLSQENPKAVLAYSTISQMGLILVMVGSAREAAAFYAAHHGLTKGALFLSVGLVAAAGGGWRWAVLGGASLLALSVAGAPLTGGALVKAAAKDALAAPAALALTLSALTTTLLLAHLLACLARTKAAPRGRPPLLLLAPPLVLGLAALALPWLIWPDWTGLPRDYPLRAASLWEAFWPVAAGLGIGLAARGAPRPRLPEGDLALPIERGVAALVRLSLEGGGKGGGAAPASWRAETLAGRSLGALRQGERVLARWRWSGLGLLAVILGLAAALAASGAR